MTLEETAKIFVAEMAEILSIGNATSEEVIEALSAVAYDSFIKGWEAATALHEAEKRETLAVVKEFFYSQGELVDDLYWEAFQEFWTKRTGKSIEHAHQTEGR